MPKVIKTVLSRSLESGPRYFLEEMWSEVDEALGPLGTFKLLSLIQCMQISLYDDGSLYAISGITIGVDGNWTARKFVVGEDDVVDRKNIWKMMMAAKDTHQETVIYNFKRELLEALENGTATFRPTRD